MTDDIGKSVFETRLFKSFEDSELKKLRKAINEAFIDGNSKCKMSKVTTRMCMGMVVKVNRIVLDKARSGYLVKCSKFFSTGDTPIFKLEEKKDSSDLKK